MGAIMDRLMLQEELLRQMPDVQADFPSLALLYEAGNGFVVRGDLLLDMVVDLRAIEGKYTVELAIPDRFPEEPPACWEVSGRIDRTFHKYKDGRLCLGTPSDIRARWYSEPTICGFLHSLVVPFLAGHAYFLSYGTMPFGEQAHGARGLLADYRFKLAANDDLTALRLLLSVLVDKHPRQCPCGSGKTFENCHSKEVAYLLSSSSSQNIYDELLSILLYIQDLEKIPPEKAAMLEVVKLSHLLQPGRGQGCA